MKKANILSCVLMVLLCMATFVVGVFCTSSFSVQITGDVSIFPKINVSTEIEDYPTLEFYVADATAKTVSVQQNVSNIPSGNLIIPSRIVCDDVSYTVTSITYTTSGTKLIPISYQTANNVGSPIERASDTTPSGGFANCTGLISVTIPNSVTTMDAKSFYGCTSLQTVVIGNRVESIEESCFTNCSSLENLTLGKSLKTIKPNAFSNCRNLKELVLPDSVTTIDSSAFANCTGIEKFHIGKGLNEILNTSDYYYNDLYFLFRYMIFLKAITVDDNNPLYNDGNNSNAVIETATNTLLIGCETTIIPNTVKCIGFRAFYNRLNLTEINLPDGLTSIGEQAFADCPNLTEVILPDSLISLGKNAFTLPGVFITYDNCYYLSSKSNTYFALVRPISSASSYTINTNCKVIADSAFLNSSMTSITIPDSVNYIGDMAFAQCFKLTTVTIGTGIKSIGDEVFVDCFSITDIYCNATTPPSIGNDVFVGCGAITLHIPTESVDAYKNSDWAQYIVE